MTGTPPTAEAVRDLVGRYCDAVLHADADTFAGCWAADAEWVMPGREPVRGRDDIVAWFTQGRAGFRLCVQELLNGVIGEGTATWQVRELQWPTDGPARCLIGVYHDVVVADDAGVARFRQRRFELRYRGPTDLSGRVYDAP